MRPFDYKESWLDNDGKPLAGRVSFCKLHTTVNEEIFDNQGYPMDNPVLTTTNGQLFAQVFLKDHTDYTVRFEKYVGEGDMSEDQDNWLFQYSCDALWDTYGISVEAGTFQLCATIADLRNLDPSQVATYGNRKIVQLGGYNSVGDKPTVLYVWNANSIENDNGGSVIKVSNIATGRWELVNTFGISGVDVRHFGVFGAQSISGVDPIMATKIGLANTYANSIGLPLYFPAIDGLTWYNLSNLNISGALFANETRVFGSTGSTSHITVADQDSYLDCWGDNSDYKANFIIHGAVVRTSWGQNAINCTYDPTYKLIIDSEVNTTHDAWAGIVVEVRVEASNLSFDGCQIESVKKLGDRCIFRNCRITESMFTDSCDFDTITVYDSDTIELADFPTTWKWVKLIAQNTAKPVDFQGRTVDSRCSIGWNTAKYRNAVFSGYQVEQETVKFDNCSGTIVDVRIANVEMVGSTITTPSTQWNSLELSDSTLRFTDSNVLVSRVTSKVSTISGNILTASMIIANDTDFVLTGISNDNILADECTIRCNLYTKMPQLTGCTISGGIYQNSIQNSIQFSIIGCTFTSSSVGHNIASTVPGTVVNGTWMNNVSMMPYHFIILDRTNLADDEQLHGYTYENNTGAHTLQRLKATWSDNIVFRDDAIDSHGGIIDSKLAAIIDQGSGHYVLSSPGRMFNTQGGTTDTSIYLTECQFFSVGTRNLGSLSFKGSCGPVVPVVIAGNVIRPFRGQVSSLENAVTDVESPWHSATDGYAKGYSFYQGYIWRFHNVGWFMQITSLTLASPLQATVKFTVDGTVPMGNLST